MFTNLQRPCLPTESRAYPSEMGSSEQIALTGTDVILLCKQSRVVFYNILSQCLYQQIIKLEFELGRLDSSVYYIDPVFNLLVLGCGTS